jgi:hypothetical protein
MKLTIILGLLFISTIDNTWLEYCVRNWLLPAPVNVCVTDPNDPNNLITYPIRVFINYEVMVSRTDSQIDAIAEQYGHRPGIAWNDYYNWCYTGVNETGDGPAKMWICDPNYGD